MQQDLLANVQRILVYKRVHNRDPDGRGVFGWRSCMVLVRGSQYQAAIGIGGIGADPQKFRIARKINWIGIGPKPVEIEVDGKKLLGVEFQHFQPFRECGWGEEGQFAFADAPPGPLLVEKSPELAKRFYERKYPPRFRILQRGEDPEFAGALRILEMAKAALPSKGWSSDAKTYTRDCHGKVSRRASRMCG